MFVIVISLRNSEEDSEMDTENIVQAVPPVIRVNFG